MATIPNNQIWIEFFETLRELPELWKVKSDIFKDRNKKKNAWDKLLDAYKKTEPYANVDSLKKRLANIRTCYRRELKKVEKSQRSGAGSEEEYIPTLWYFEALDFLRDQEVQIPGVSSIDLEQDEVEVDEAEVSTKFISFELFHLICFPFNLPSMTLFC
jgi:Alcohol dehydrogenase transcription factor Myb/SANT-like.